MGPRVTRDDANSRSRAISVAPGSGEVERIGLAILAEKGRRSASSRLSLHVGLFCKGRGLECKSSAPGAAPSSSASSGPERTSQPENEVARESSVPGSRQLESPSTPALVISYDGNASEEGNSSFTPHDPPSHHPNQNAGAHHLPVSSPSVSTPRPGPNGLWTLDDNVNRTAHSMGPAAEQDTHLLDSIRSGILSSPDDVDADMIQVYAGSKYPWDPPVHFCLLQDEFAKHDDAAKKAASRAVEDLVGPYGPILVRLYFKHVHPVLPILSKVRFLRQYAADKTKLPASLRGAVYALASVSGKREPSLKGPFPFQQHQLADYATDSLQRELDAPNLAKLQAGLLLLHVKPNDVDSIEHPRTWTSTAQAVATAQMIGLHQDAERWRIAPWEKRLRRKLWWATYVADVWSAVCHGNPPHIYAASFNTSDITMDDLRSDEDVPEELQMMVDPASASFQHVTGARFLKLVEVSRTLRDLIDCSFQVPRLRPPEGEESTKSSRLLGLKNRLSGWDALLPQCLAMPPPERAVGASNNAPLHLAYYAYLALLFRALMSPATTEAKKDTSSSLRRWFRTAVTEYQGFTTFIDAVTAEDLQGFWGRRTFTRPPHLLIAARNMKLTRKCRCPVPAHPLREFPHLSLPPSKRGFRRGISMGSLALDRTFPYVVTKAGGASR
nr:fungal specific transcription factor domain-containing protein [Colletotrichum truncatum]KAF6787664.1 fungal specific transcription factor domain-containing protein [Colletotrichum truncatum]